MKEKLEKVLPHIILAVVALAALSFPVLCYAAAWKFVFGG